MNLVLGATHYLALYLTQPHLRMFAMFQQTNQKYLQGNLMPCLARFSIFIRIIFGRSF